MFIIKYRKIWYTLSVLLIGLSIWAMLAYGFNLSIDFKGGSITELRYDGARPDKSLVEESVRELHLGGFSVRPSEDDTYVIRTKVLNSLEIESLVGAASAGGDRPSTERSNTVGPVAGAELQSKAVKAISVVVIMIVLFVTFAFRKVSKPVSSWKYGLATIIALAHDIIIPTGIFVFLGHLAGVEIDLLFVTGLLAILGYSVHDTIVVFDRVRENLGSIGKPEEADFEALVGRAVMQTMGRSINTSLTLLITLGALYAVGSAATRDFSLLLIVGIIVGAYSSIFIASPLLVTFYKLQKK